MIEIIFTINGQNLKFICHWNNIMRNVFKKLLMMMGKDNPDSFLLLYNGNKVDENLTVAQIANYNDKMSNSMRILVVQKDDMFDHSFSQRKNEIDYTGKIMINIIYERKKKWEVSSKHFLINLA